MTPSHNITAKLLDHQGFLLLYAAHHVQSKKSLAFVASHRERIELWQTKAQLWSMQPFRNWVECMYDHREAEAWSMIGEALPPFDGMSLIERNRYARAKCSEPESHVPPSCPVGTDRFGFFVKNLMDSVPPLLPLCSHPLRWSWLLYLKVTAIKSRD